MAHLKNKIKVECLSLRIPKRSKRRVSTMRREWDPSFMKLCMQQMPSNLLHSVYVKKCANPGLFYLKKWVIPGHFFLYFRLFNTVDNKNVQYNYLPKTGFEPQTSGIKSNHSTNLATTTAFFILVLFKHRLQQDSNSYRRRRRRAHALDHHHGPCVNVLSTGFSPQKS